MTEWPKRSALCINDAVSIKLSSWGPFDESSLNTIPDVSTHHNYPSEPVASISVCNETHIFIYLFLPMFSLIILSAEASCLFKFRFLTLFMLINKQNVLNPTIFISIPFYVSICLLFIFIVILQQPWLHQHATYWDKGYMQMYSLYLIRRMLMKNVVLSSF